MDNNNNNFGTNNNIFDTNKIISIADIKNVTTTSMINGHHNNLINFSTTSNQLSAKFLWNIIDSKLEVFSFDEYGRNRIVALFDFGQIFKEPNIIINQVIRLATRFEMLGSKYRHPHKLIVILQFSNLKNYICIVDIRLNAIVNTIEFPFNITCAEVILSQSISDELTKTMPLIDELCCMNGCLAIGCDGGLVFFIDLILDSYSPEPLIPKMISMITHKSNQNMENKRRTAIFHNQSLCISLNLDAKNKGKFNYRADDGTIMMSFPQNQVYVSALHHIPQLSIICVGYNFGGFHLYNLNEFNVECSCSIESDLLPVIEFAFQLPEDDPKNYSYLWLIRGRSYRSSNIIYEEFIENSSQSTAFIYLLCYQNKNYVENYGILYDTFKYCCCKFELPLTSSYEKTLNLICSSSLLDMFTIYQTAPNKPEQDDHEPVPYNPIDFNYLMIAWQTYGKNHNASSFYFCIFDLNQWYKSEMPPSFCLDENGFCPFISIYSLNNVSKLFHTNSIDAVYCANTSITKYSSSSFYMDIHSYPVSLSFNMIVASKSQLCSVKYNSPQQELISELYKISDLKIFFENSQDFLLKCWKCSLISGENFQNELSSGDAKFHLFQLMDMALENNLQPLLIKFSKADGLSCSEMAEITEWIWTKVESMKNSIDLLTRPLFDRSGGNVSRQDICQLVCFQSELLTLSIMLKNLLNKTTSMSINLNCDVRLEIVELLQTYLKFVLLFENFELLPDQDLDAEKVDLSRPIYFQEKLATFYQKRRQELLDKNTYLFKSNVIPLIDVIIKHYEPQLSTIWEKQDSNSLYPPKDLFSLLQLFLLDQIPLIYKESILLYFLYDFSDCNSQHSSIFKKLLIFISQLKIPSSLANFIEGWWHLDHQNYELALQWFIHPIVNASLNEFKVNTSLFSELIQRIIELFLCEGQYQKALIFSKSCNHVLLDQEQNENLGLQILLYNRNLLGALEFQRKRRSQENCDRLLHKIFFLCVKLGIIAEFCGIPLDEYEEKIFIHYLHNSDANLKIILVLYFILNNKLTDAIQFYKEFEQELHEEKSNQDIIDLVEGYAAILPHSALELARDIIVSKSDNKPESLEITTMNCHKSCYRTKKIQKPIYLSESRISCSKITKAKHQSLAARKLFSILKTPNLKSKIIEISRIDSISAKSILKQIPIPSAADDDTSCNSSQQKLKVSFVQGEDISFSESLNPPTNHTVQQEEERQPVLNQKESVNEENHQNTNSAFSTPTKRLARKPISSAGHRMILRSDKKN